MNSYEICYSSALLYILKNNFLNEKSYMTLFCRNAIVLMKSMSGSGHRYAALRQKGADKLEQYKFDPWGKYYLIET